VRSRLLYSSLERCRVQMLATLNQCIVSQIALVGNHTVRSLSCCFCKRPERRDDETGSTGSMQPAGVVWISGRAHRAPVTTGAATNTPAIQVQVSIVYWYIFAQDPAYNGSAITIRFLSVLHSKSFSILVYKH